MSLSAILKDTSGGKSIIVLLYSDVNYYIILFITILTAASGIAYFFESKQKVNSELA
jgi:hypothetical protein